MGERSTAAPHCSSACASLWRVKRNESPRVRYCGEGRPSRRTQIDDEWRRRCGAQGKNYIEMVQLIVRVLGTPSAEQLYFVSDKAREFIRNLPQQQGTGFAKL